MHAQEATSPDLMACLQSPSGQWWQMLHAVAHPADLADLDGPYNSSFQLHHTTPHSSYNAAGLLKLPFIHSEGINKQSMK